MNVAANEVELFDVMKGEEADNDFELVRTKIDVFDCASAIFDAGVVGRCAGAFQHFFG